MPKLNRQARYNQGAVSAAHLLYHWLPSDSGPVPQEAWATYNVNCVVGHPDPAPHYVQRVSETCIPDPIQEVVQHAAHRPYDVDAIEHVRVPIPVGQIVGHCVSTPVGQIVGRTIQVPVERSFGCIAQVPRQVQVPVRVEASVPRKVFRAQNVAVPVEAIHVDVPVPLEQIVEEVVQVRVSKNGSAGSGPADGCWIDTATTAVGTRDFFAKYPATLSDPGFNLSDGCPLDALVNAAAQESDRTPSGHATEVTTAVAAAAPVPSPANERSNAATPAIVSTAQHHRTPSGHATEVSADTEP